MNQDTTRVLSPFRTLVFILFATLLLAACSDKLGANDADQATLSLSVQVRGLTESMASAGASGYVLITGTDTLEIDHVGIVLREIELERSSHMDCDDLEDSPENDDDFCEEFETGPILLEPSLDGSIEHVISLEVPEGEYDELEFDVHKLHGDSPENVAFLVLFPEFIGLSIRALGSFNGEPFVFEQDLHVEQEIDLDPPLVVSGFEATNVTLILDLSLWFRTAHGDLLNPSSANHGGVNESLVEHNIKNSFDAFEDDDEDGERDHDDHHDDDHDDDDDDHDDDHHDG